MTGTSPFAGRRKPCETWTKTGSRRVLGAAIREEGRADTFALAAVGVVAHRADGEMHFVGMSLGAGRDRIESRLQLLQKDDQFVRRELRRHAVEHVDDFAAPEPLLQIGAPRGIEKVAQFAAPGCARRRP